MSETDPTPSQTPAPPPTPPPAVRPTGRRRRPWVRWVLVLLVLLVVGVGLLVAAAPTLVGLGPVKNLILSQVNKRLNGRVEVASLSVGWTSGVHLGGVRVFDAENKEIATLDKADVPIHLLAAIRGHYALGETVIDGLSADARYDAAGRLNFAELVKSDGTPAKPAATPSKASGPSKLPDVSGDVTVRNCRATVSKPGEPTVYLTDVGGHVKIPDLNQPVTDQLAATVKVGDGPPGTVKADGTVAAVKNGAVDVDSADLHQTVDVAGLDAAAAKPFLTAAQQIDDVGGLMDLHVVLDSTGGKSVVAVLTLSGKNVLVGGKALSGDTFKSDALVFSIPKLTGEFPNGMVYWETGHVTTAEPITLAVDQAKLSLSADAPLQAVLNVLANKVPGAAGRIDYSAEVDVAKLARAVPDAMHLYKGVTLTTGTAKQSLAVKMDAAKALLAGSLDLTGIAGTTSDAGGPAKPVALSDVHAKFAATDLGGTGKSVLPDVRDVSADLQSSFATGDLKGTTLADLNGKLTADLSKALAEVGQIVDTKGLQLSGTVAATVEDKGDLLNGPRQAAVKAGVAVRDLVFQKTGGTRVDEKAVDVALNADLHGSDNEMFEHATDAKLTMTLGDAAAPTVSVLAQSPDVSLTGGPAEFTAKVVADLVKAQRELAAIPAGKAGTVVTAGTMTATANGTYAGKHVDVKAVDVDATVTAARQLEGGRQVAALTNDAIKIHAAATVDQTPVGDKTDTTVRVSALTVADSAKLVSVGKSSAGDLTVTTRADGGYAGSGQVAVTADLAGINRVNRTLGMTEVAVRTPAGDLRTGVVDGKLTLSTAADGTFTADGQFRAGDLVVVTPTGPLPTQSANLVVKATYSPATKAIAVDEASVKGSFVTAAITKASVSPDAKELLAKVRSAHYDVNVTDLRTLTALLAAFQAPEPVAVAKTPAGAPASPAAVADLPRVFDAGTVTASGDLTNDGKTTALTAAVGMKNVAFHKGSYAYQAKPANLEFAAAVEGGGTGDSVLTQVRQIRVNKLAGDLAGVGTLKMTTPITDTSPGASPVVTGAVEISGKLADLAALVAAWEGKPADAYPYRGDYDVTEAVTSKASTITVKGGITVANFQAMNGAAVAFAEPKLAVGNDLDYTTTTTGAVANADVTVRSLSVDMQQTKALNFTVANGSVKHLDTDRLIDLVAAVDIDWAKAWPAVQPLVGEKYKSVKMAGLWQRKVTVGGSYPADKPFEQAVAPLTVDGGVVVGLFDYKGLVVKNLDLPFAIRGGKLVTAKPAAGPQCTANDGPFYLDAVTVDLTQSPMRVTTPDNKVVLSEATINPLFADTYLSSILNNPVFVGANQASGLLDLTIDHCSDLPLGDLATEQVPANAGQVKLSFSLIKLHIGSQGIGDALKLINKSNAGGDSFDAEVRGGTVSLARGVATENITFSTGRYNIPFAGNVILSTKAFQGFTVGVPGSALAQAFTHDQNIINAVPPTALVPVNGTLTSPQPDLAGAFGLQVQKVASDPTKVIQGLLNGNKGGAGAGGQPPVANDPAKAVGDLLNGFGKKKR